MSGRLRGGYIRGSLMKSNVFSARRSSGSPPAVPELRVQVLTPVLQKANLVLRSDHLRDLRSLALDLALDDYNFSQAEIVRCSLAIFLSLPLGELVASLEDNRRREKLLGFGRGVTRPGGGV